MVLIPAIVPLALFAAFAALFFAINAKMTGDAFANWANGLTPLARLILVKPVQLSLSLARHLTHNIGGYWKQFEGLAVTWLSGLFQWAYLAVSQAMDWPLKVFQVMTWIVDVEVPRLIKAALRGVHGAVKVVTHVLPKVERTIVRFPKLTKAQIRAALAAALSALTLPYLAPLRWLRSHLHALQAVIGHALPGVSRPTFPNIWKRIRALEKKLAVPVGVAAVAAALARLGIGWTRCNNVRKVGKRVCGMDLHNLEALIGQTLGIFGSLSIVALTEELVTITPAVADGVGFFVAEAPAAFHAITDAERAAANAIADSIDAIIGAI